MGTQRHRHNRARAVLALIVGLLVAATLLPAASAVATATFIVNSITDAVDAAPGNGACATSGSVCTLRAAVMESNALAGADVITLGAGPHTLSLTGSDEEAAASGDLDITSDVTINGVASMSTVVIGSGDRVFNVRTGGSLDLSGMQVTGGSSFRGAGVYVESGSLDVTDVRFVDNSSGGGAVYLSPSTTSTMTRSLFWRNSSSALGGGILNHQATLTIDASEFVDNTATTGGGGLSNLGGTTTITNSTFRGNRADMGGAIENGYANDDHGPPTLTLTNVTISENGANHGGSLRHVRGTASLTNVTIARNWANLAAGLNWGFAQTGITVKNSIIADNWSGFPPFVDDCFTDGHALTSLGHNITTEAACPFTGTDDRTSTDPQLLPLADHGGDTFTMGLPPGSPAILGGDCSASGGAIWPGFDQRGLARSAICDVGAFEYQPFELVMVWDLANDFETDDEQDIQPDPDQYGNPGVWSYRQSSGTAHDVTTYQPYDSYNRNVDAVAEFEGWWPSGQSGPSSIVKNGSAQSHAVTSRSFLPGRTSFHPAQDGRMAVAAWTAPFAMTVTISGHAFDRDWGCGTGFGWAVETSTDGTATTALASGSEANGGSVSFHHPELRDVEVAEDQTIYLVISPDGGWDCDTTEVDLTITRLGIPNFNPNVPGRLLYMHGRGVDDLVAVNADGTESEVLVPNDNTLFAGASPSSADWSADGHRIVVQTFSGAQGGDLYTMNPDRSGIAKIYDNDEAGEAYWPAWSPDGKQIAFHVDEGLFVPGGADGIAVINADGSGSATVLFADGFLTGSPSWSPDGRSIVFTTHIRDGAESGPEELWIVPTTGGAATRILDPQGTPVIGHHPTWSPDGNWIAYWHHLGGNMTELRKIRPNGTGSRLILETYSATGSDWGDTGRIAFAMDADRDDGQHNLDIFTVRPDGSGLAQVTSTDDQLNGKATWRPEPATADLRTRVTAPELGLDGERLRWTVKVDNLGPDVARWTTVKIAVEKDRATLSTAFSSGADDRCSLFVGVTAHVVTCELYRMAAGSGATITVKGTSKTNRQIPISARATTISTDPATPNNSDSGITNPPADVAVAAVAPRVRTLPVGQVGTYKFRVRNFGPGRAFDTRLMASLPSHVTFVQASSSDSGDACTYSKGGLLLMCRLGDLAKSNTAYTTITLKVKPTTAKKFLIEGQVSSDVQDLVGANNRVTFITNDPT